MGKFLAQSFYYTFALIWLMGAAHAASIQSNGASSGLAPAKPLQTTSLTVPLQQSPTLGSNCGSQSTIVGTDNAGVITIGPVASGSWNLGCTINFSQSFQTPACVLTVSGGQSGNGIRIAQTKSDSLLFISQPNSFQGGEDVMYLCSEAAP